MVAKFASWGHVGQIVSDPKQVARVAEDKLFDVTCLPMYSILLALGNPTVDYFSLDVEGAEYDVLKTIPYDDVDIKVRVLKILKKYSYS